MGIEITKTLRVNREQVKEMIERKFNVKVISYTLSSQAFIGEVE